MKSAITVQSITYHTTKWEKYIYSEPTRQSIKKILTLLSHQKIDMERTSKQLLAMARGVVSGMKYLSEMNFIHRVSLLNFSFFVFPGQYHTIELQSCS